MKAYLGMALILISMLVQFAGSLLILVLFFGGIYVLFFESVVYGLAMMGGSWVVAVVCQFLIGMLIMISAGVIE